MFSAGRAKWLEMVAYEFCIHDEMEELDLIGILRERRKDPLKGTPLFGRAFVFILHLKHENIQWGHMWVKTQEEV